MTESLPFFIHLIRGLRKLLVLMFSIEGLPVTLGAITVIWYKWGPRGDDEK